MKPTDPTFTSLPLAAAYRQFYLSLRIRQAKICFILAMVMVPACIGLDHFVYPQLAWRMFRARLWCDVAMLPCFLMLFSTKSQRFVRLIDSAPLVLAALAICYMIYLADGAMSPYYAGINIVMAAAILLIPYTLREAVLVCGFVIGAYVLACVAHGYSPPAISASAPSDLSTQQMLINNCYFLALTAVIALTSCHFASVRRFAEFRLRHELDSKNTEIATTLEKLQATEVQLVHSEKLNALGRLSAGLLHEINNPLNFTFMALQVAEQDAADNPAMQETLADIGQGMSRIRGVVADLRAFAYPSKSTEKLEFDVDDALTTAMRLTTHELANIAIDHTQIAGMQSLGAKTQLVHVFMNLLVNAAHATRKQSLREPAIIVGCQYVHDRLRVSVRDNGTGIKPAERAKIFEPFFTTKIEGEGMGLGLSICQTIIQNHGGTLSVDSMEGEWTEFSFDLPMAVPLRQAA